MNHQKMKVKKILKGLFGKADIIVTRGILIKALAVTILIILFAPVSSSHDGSFEYLNSMSLDTYDPEILTDEEEQYIEFLLSRNMKDILPKNLQEELLGTDFNNLEEIIQKLQYTNIWKLGYVELDITENLKLIKVFRDEVYPSKFIAGVLCNKSLNKYNVIGLDEMSLELFNQKVSLILNTPQDIVSYAQIAIRLIKSYTFIYDSQVSPESLGYNESLKDTITGPQILLHHENYYVIEMYAYKYYLFSGGGHTIDKLLVIVSTDGRISILTEKMN